MGCIVSSVTDKFGAKRSGQRERALGPQLPVGRSNCWRQSRRSRPLADDPSCWWFGAATAQRVLSVAAELRTHGLAQLASFIGTTRVGPNPRYQEFCRQCPLPMQRRVRLLT
jgi:hypothetical protein